MNQYEQNYRKLMELMGGKKFRLFHFPPHESLLLQKLEGGPFISLSYCVEQDGHPVKDPDMVFLIDGEAAKPVYYRNDESGIEHATIGEFFGELPVEPHLQESLDTFCQDWWTNIEEQGFFRVAKLAPKQNVEEGEIVFSFGEVPDYGPDMEM